ncbi:MAG TPA: D-glycerate dehydrogenase [Kosmotogaceae bacterium]|nr:MAG: D-isomer specific 2-hydroxyacid dehydrogenase NAD-binding [Thermotogales bacterium 46_20]HAA86200.1 D-glycerate dehydrogenase [Kosmotogaceae bacterium]
MQKISVTYKLPEEGLRLLRRYDLKVNAEDRFLSKPELIDFAYNADALITLLSDQIDREVIERLENLKVIANYAVGFNNIDIVAAKERGVVVTNTPGVLTEATADLTMALILATTRRLVEGDRFVRRGLFDGWKPELLLGVSLKDRVLGIIGLGRIGKAVVQRAKAFGMKVVYHNRMPASKKEEKALSVEYKSLEDLLKLSDVVSVHVPLTKETRHLIGSSRLKLMKPTGVLINTSRGAVIDEQALIQFLRERRIFAAGLDVFENEPEIPYALRELDNVVLLPHLGSATRETRMEMALMVARNVIAVLNGKRPPNRVV